MTSPFAIADSAGCGPVGRARGPVTSARIVLRFRPVLVPETRLERSGQAFHSEGSRRSRNLWVGDIPPVSVTVLAACAAASPPDPRLGVARRGTLVSSARLCQQIGRGCHMSLLVAVQRGAWRFVTSAGTVAEARRRAQQFSKTDPYHDYTRLRQCSAGRLARAQFQPRVRLVSALRQHARARAPSERRGRRRRAPRPLTRRAAPRRSRLR